MTTESKSMVTSFALATTLHKEAYVSAKSSDWLSSQSPPSAAMHPVLPEDMFGCLCIELMSIKSVPLSAEVAELVPSELSPFILTDSGKKHFDGSNLPNRRLRLL